MVLIPKTLKKADISNFQYNVKHSISKSLNTSLFICNTHVYKEVSLQMKSSISKEEMDISAVSTKCTLESVMSCVAV